MKYVQRTTASSSRVIASRRAVCMRLRLRLRLFGYVLSVRQDRVVKKRFLFDFQRWSFELVTSLLFSSGI